jgi:hypothetical protein
MRPTAIVQNLNFEAYLRPPLLACGSLVNCRPVIVMRWDNGDCMPCHGPSPSRLRRDVVDEAGNIQDRRFLLK